MAGWHRFDVLIRPAALLAVVLVAALWDRQPSPHVKALPAPAPQEQPVATAPTPEQMSQCARKSGEEFRKAWSDRSVGTDGWMETAEYASHYNPKLDTCFYLLTIERFLPGGEPAGSLRKMLFDVNEGELYGEYRGPEAGGAPGAGLPNTCRVTGFYCASRREWDRLAGTFMESSP